MSVEVTTSGASGTSTQELSFAIGKNQTRAPRTLTLSLRSSDSTIDGGTLTITQEYTALHNFADGETTQSINATNDVQTVTFNGNANGKYMWYELSQNASGILTVTSALEYSRVQQGDSFGTAATQVGNFEGGSSDYDYEFTVSIPANVAADDYTITTYSCDTIDGTPAHRVYTIATANDLCTGMTITGDAVSGNTGNIDNTNNSATYRVTYTPEETTQNRCTWSLTGEGARYATLTVNQSDEDECTVEVSSGVDNKTLVLTATNAFNNTIYATLNISAVYNASVGLLVIRPNTVTGIVASATTDSTPEVIVQHVRLSSISAATTGFITGANVVTSGDTKLLVTTFPSNSYSPVPQNGTVTLSAVDEYLNRLSASATYQQNGEPNPEFSVTPTALAVTAYQTDNYWHTNMAYTISYSNSGGSDLILSGITYTIRGRSSSTSQSDTFVVSGTLDSQRVNQNNSISISKTVTFDGVKTANYYIIELSGYRGTDCAFTSSYSGTGNDLIIANE